MSFRSVSSFRLPNSCWLVLVLLSFGKLSAQDYASPGFQGYVQLTGGPIWFASNTVSTLVRNSLTDSRAESFDEKASLNPLVTGLFQLEVGYTTKNSRYNFSFGNSLQDLVRFDVVQQLAFRRFLANEGYFGISYLLSTIPIGVWQDPYVLNEERVSTRRDSQGIRIELSKIGSTKLGVQYDVRFIRLDEKSGEYLNLTDQEMQLLDRNGLMHRMALTHRHTKGSFRLLSTLRFIYDQSDGKASSGLGTTAEVTFGTFSGKVTNLATLFGSYWKSFEQNPVFSQTEQTTGIGVREVFYYQLTANPQRSWSAMVSASYILGKSNIDFLTTEGLLAQAGIIFRFKPSQASHTSDI